MTAWCSYFPHELATWQASLGRRRQKPFTRCRSASFAFDAYVWMTRLKLDRRAQVDWRRPARPFSKWPSATASRSRTCATRKAWTPVGNCRACMVEIKGERVLAPCCCRAPSARMEVEHRQRAGRRSRRSWCWSCCWPTCPRARYTRHNELDEWAAKLGVGKPRFAPRAQLAARPVAPGHRRQPRRLHPVHALRARLPRRAGQRRDRPRLARRTRQDRVRPGRPRWAPAPAWPAANACRPAPPAR